MADEKFSQFPAVADPAGGEIVGTKSGDNARFPASAFATPAQVDAKVVQTITNGVTTSAPSQDAVFDALSLKSNLASPTFTGTVTIPTLNVTTINSGTLSGNNTGDQTTIVGITGTKTQFNTTLTDGDFAYATDLNTKVSALGNRAPNEAVLIIALGDSNMQGANTTNLSVQSANTNVFVRASDGIAPNQNPATDVTWRNVDPNGAAVTDNAGWPNPYWGLIRNGKGTADWALADTLQRELSAPTYLVSVSCSAATSAYWLPTGGGGMDTLQLYLTAAINDITTSGTLPAGWVAPTQAHVVLWSEGANDVNGGLGGAGFIVPPQTFVDNMKTIRDFMVAQGWTSQDTLTLNMNMCPTWTANLNNQWPGINYLDVQTNEYYRILSSRDKEVEADTLHYTPVGLDKFGKAAAEIALKGLQPKTYNAQGANNFEYSGLGKYAYTSPTPNLGATAGVVAPAYLDISANHAWSGSNGLAIGGVDLPAGLLFSGVQTYADNGATFASGAVISNIATFTNPAGVTKNFASYPTLFSGVKYVADGAAFNATGVITDIFLNNTFTAPSGGSIAGVSGGLNVTSLDIRTTFGSAANGISQGLINVTDRTGISIFSASRNAGSGSTLPTIANQFGIFINTMAGATNNVGLALGTGTLVGGSWALQQIDSLPCRFNGALNTKIETISGATASVTCGDDDHTFYFTGTAACAFNLPTATAAMQGRIYKVVNSNLTAATGNPTFNSGSSNIDNGTASLVAATAAIPAGTSLSVQCVGTAGWTIV